MKRPLACLLFMATPVMADPPVIEAASASRSGEAWRIDVTLSHPDTGWEHYADGWEVLSPDGTLLGQRELLHPHVIEQPFTRSLTSIEIPPDLDEVVIRARCLVDGWAAETYRLVLDR